MVERVSRDIATMSGSTATVSVMVDCPPGIKLMSRVQKPPARIPARWPQCRWVMS
jgi:hypothetical protein